MDCGEQIRCLELAKSSSFCRTIYSEIEEVGWERLVRLGGDLTFLSFHVLDEKGRVHVLEIQLDKTYPKDPPMVSADVPYMFNLEWSMNSRLKDLVKQFQEHLEKLQEFWSTLDEIDRSFWVVDPKSPTRAMSFRQIQIGNGCVIMLSINVNNPKSLPECRFMGSGTIVNTLRKIWKRNSKRWLRDKTFQENLASILETQLPRSRDFLRDDRQVECGICYAQCLPIDDELGTKSGSGTDYTCENTNCSRAFHSMCLVDWLHSIATTRQSFNVLFGNCPYCSEPVAVKLNNAK
ncbi:hypothetical protein SLE2022_363900 [Rubroshorea leprosula]